MNTTVAVMGIIVEKMDSVEVLNSLLHEYGEKIVGRMGIPYREKGIHVISLVVDAERKHIEAMAEKIGALEGVSVETAYSDCGR